MERIKIQQIIFNAIEMVNNLRDDDDSIPVSESTELYGTNGHLDSMGLVGLLMDIEESMQDEGFDISLSDDRAMSQKHSPFKNVSSLTDYIETLMSGE
jgi:acyl carrier protein